MSALITWLNTNGGAVQGIAVVVLVLVTAFYGYQTWRQAKATEKVVEATEKLAGEAQKQRVDSLKPVVVYRGWGTSGGSGLQYPGIQIDSDHLSGQVANIGPGPALDITIELLGRQAKTVPVGHLGAGEHKNVPLQVKQSDEKAPGQLALRLVCRDIFGNRKVTSQILNQNGLFYSIVDTKVEDPQEA